MVNEEELDKPEANKYPARELADVELAVSVSKKPINLQIEQT